MKLVIKQAPLTGMLKWGQRVCFGCGILLLGYCGFVMADAWLFQRRQAHYLERMLEERQWASGGTLNTRQVIATSPPAVIANGLIARLEIPRLGLSTVVMEGDDSKTLRRSVGHIRGTALPGQAGNVALTGHRDTFFRPLRNIRAEDVIVLTTSRGEYDYRVVSTRVVRPDNVSVLNAGDSEILTLVTCYPFYFVGSAPSRFIVRAERLTR